MAGQNTTTEPPSPLVGVDDTALMAEAQQRNLLKEPLAKLADDDILKELAKRNIAVVYSAVRAIDPQGRPQMPTLMVHGGEMNVHACLSRLQMFVFTGQTTRGASHG